MDARPITIDPVPILISPYPWFWATKAPDTEISPLEITSPKTLDVSVFPPKARTINSLFPVALSAHPISVPKNQYRAAITMAPIMTPTTNVASV